MGWTDDVGSFFKWTADPGGIFKDENKTDPANARFADRDYLRTGFQTGVDEILYGRKVPQAQRTQLDESQQAQFRNQQMAQANRLGAIASGQQQGAGELAAQRQANRSIAQQQAMARMGRGQAGASRMAARNVADIGTSAAGQSQAAALQDQQAANAQLGQIIGQGRAQDQAMASQNAQLEQQRQLAAVDAQLRARGMDDQTRIAYLNQLAQMNQAEMNARMAQEATAAGIPSQSSQMMQAAGPIIAAAAMSDKRAKKNIRDGSGDIDEMLDNLKAVSYEYRKGAPEEYVGKLGDGRRIAGFIAQDLARSKAGKAIVSETPDGKQVVDVRGGLFAAIAASARLNERVKALESKKE
jgi:hypothetical protein